MQYMSQALPRASPRPQPPRLLTHRERALCASRRIISLNSSYLATGKKVFLSPESQVCTRTHLHPLREERVKPKSSLPFLLSCAHPLLSPTPCTAACTSGSVPWKCLPSHCFPPLWDSFPHSCPEEWPGASRIQPRECPRSLLPSPDLQVGFLKWLHQPWPSSWFISTVADTAPPPPPQGISLGQAQGSG